MRLRLVFPNDGCNLAGAATTVMGEVTLRGMPNAPRDKQEIDDPDGAERSRAALERETAALKARVAELEQLRLRLEDFAALVAHELVKPLVLAGSRVSELLEENGTELDVDTHLDLKIVVDACSRARMLVEALLADAQQRGSAMQRELVDVGWLVRDWFAMLAPDIERGRARV
jgi:light-regulated signal transduction histidine kinase (bacteriophytochrome)